MQEIERLLAPGGRSCIIPLFLTERYTECWNINHDSLFDEHAELLIDSSATIPGADKDGHFARFYDLDAFHNRIFITATELNLSIRIFTCRLGGKDLPDMKKNFGSNLNYPLHAILLEKPI